MNCVLIVKEMKKMKIKSLTTTKIGYLFCVISAVTIFACKNENSKKNNKVTNKQEESNVEKHIDTSYKKNIRLFDQFYYDMPESTVAQVNAELDKKTESDHAILTFKNENIYFKKEFFYEAGLLKKVKLVANNITNTRENSPIILDLFNSKYGKSTLKEDKQETDEIQTIATRIIDYKEGNSFTEKTSYDSKIHRKISNNEFKEYLNNSLYSSFCNIANNDLQIVSLGEDTFYKVMKDVTKDEFVNIPVEVSIKKIPYKKTVVYNEYTWMQGTKKITLYCFKSLNYKGNKYTPREIGVNTDLIVTFSKVEKSSIKNNTESNEDLKLKEKETLNAI